MAWTVSTYSGQKANGSTAKWRTAMFELIRAVHEREDVTKQSRSSFYKADGTTATTITLADLDGMQITGTGSLVGENLDRIRTYIVDNADKYTEDDTNEVEWTVANLGTDISADLTVEPTKATDAAYWQMLQDALDRLIYPWGHLTCSNTGNISPAAGTESDIKSTIALAWADRVTNSTSGNIIVGVSAVTAGALGSWRAIINPSSETTFAFWFLGERTFGGQVDRPTAGTINSAYYLYTKASSSLATSVSFTVGGESVTVSSGDNTDDEVAITAPSLASDPAVTVSVSVPTSSPFDEESSPTGDTGTRRATLERIGGFGASAIRIYMDISSELTDQA